MSKEGMTKDLEAIENIVVYIAHDDRVTVLEFIISAFLKTIDKIMIKATPHAIFKRELTKNSLVIMAGNVNGSPSQNSNMYVVFVK